MDLHKEMKVCLAVVFCFIVTVSNSMIELSSSWRPDVGFEITCSWRLFSNDSLQSVRLCNNGQQFMIFRPLTDGTSRNRFFRLPDNVFHVDCTETSQFGITGKCVILMELYQPMVDAANLTCEVSGERPTFRIESKDIHVPAFVGPINTVINTVPQHQISERITLNCSSRGMPKPNLVWTIGNQKIPEDFSKSSWNVSSKLWEVWSIMSFSPRDEPAKCTPEITRGSQTTRGQSVEYNSATLYRTPVLTILFLIIIVVIR